MRVQTSVVVVLYQPVSCYCFKRLIANATKHPHFKLDALHRASVVCFENSDACSNTCHNSARPQRIDLPVHIHTIPLFQVPNRKYHQKHAHGIDWPGRKIKEQRKPGSRTRDTKKQRRYAMPCAGHEGDKEQVYARETMPRNGDERFGIRTVSAVAGSRSNNQLPAKIMLESLTPKFGRTRRARTAICRRLRTWAPAPRGGLGARLVCRGDPLAFSSRDGEGGHGPLALSFVVYYCDRTPYRCGMSLQHN